MRVTSSGTGILPDLGSLETAPHGPDPYRPAGLGFRVVFLRLAPDANSPSVNNTTHHRDGGSVSPPGCRFRSDRR